MKIAFFSNYLSPHQIPFSEAMFEIIGENYKFISCECYSEDRKKMGWIEETKKQYEIRAFESEEDFQTAKEIAKNCDVMIIGSASWEFVKIRIESGKIIFKYSERLLKKGLWNSLISLDFFRHMKMNLNCRSKNLYFLSASMYAPFDYKLTLGHFKEQYKWGYFPLTNYYEFNDLMYQKENENKIKILWVGRLIPLKHPEVAILLMEKLVKIYNNVELRIIGSGILENKIKKLVSEKELDNNVFFLGSMAPEDVRGFMEKSNIFLFTSDYNEGWGAVLNEAMNSACSIICCSSIGASGYLIKNGVNGYTYDLYDFENLFKIAKCVIDNKNIRYELGKNAYNTIINEWSAEIAAQRLVKLCTGILNDSKKIEYDDGPLSKAKIIRPAKLW